MRLVRARGRLLRSLNLTRRSTSQLDNFYLKLVPDIRLAKKKNGVVRALVLDCDNSHDRRINYR